MTVSAPTTSATLGKPADIRALTGLRGIAALYVVIFHANLDYPLPSFIQPFIQHGYMAVDLFFLLSGFIIAHTSGQLFEHGFTLKNYKRFLLLRLARIYPLYLVITLFMSGVVMLALHSTNVTVSFIPSLFFNLTLTDIWGMAPPIIPPSWSISAEWAAYLLFPVLFAIAFKGPNFVGYLGFVVALAILIGVTLGPHRLPTINHISRGLDVVGPHEPGTVLRCLAEFFLGLIAYRNRLWIPEASSLWLLLAAIVLLYFRNSDIALVGVFAVFIMALSRDRGFIAKGFQGRVLHWLGLISYALYLLHDLVLKLLFAFFPAKEVTSNFNPEAVVMLIILSVAVASICHYGFEKRSRMWFHKAFILEEAVTVQTFSAKAV